MKRTAVFALTVSVMLAGCAAPGDRTPPGQIGNNKTTGGALIGAGLGAFAGSKIGKGSGSVAAAVAGGLLGALAGGAIGSSLDKADIAYAEQTNQRALETAKLNQQVTWRNPDTGNYGTITPVKTYQSGNSYCREFQQTIVVGGQTENAYGTACRQPDGSWKIVNS